MTTAASVATGAFTNAVIVDQHDLRFDAGDPKNGSLYVCTPRGAPAPEAGLAVLRAAGLWSAEPEKTVADEQRGAYRDGLVFVAAQAYRSDAGDVLLARFDHPKYPSDPARWEAWLALFDTHYERLG